MTAEQQDLCPTPPQLSLNDAENDASGRLESENVFVDETLLRKGNDMDPEVFIRRIQAGFVLSYRDPPFSVCGCNNVDIFSQQYVSELSECTSSGGAQIYALKQDSQFSQSFDWLDRDCGEYSSGSGSSGSGSSGSGSGASGSGASGSSASGSGSGPVFSGDYAVDGVSANLLQLLACSNVTNTNSGCDGESEEQRPAAEYYPDQSPQISATVFYNNNVKTRVMFC